MIEIYRAISEFSQAMLEFARQEQWDDLLEAEKKRAEVMGKLLSLMNEGKGGSAEQQDEIILLIKQIQSCDEETVSLAQAWMGELDSILNSMGSSKRLQQAYKKEQ